MTTNPLTKVPWQFSVILTILVYSGTTYIGLRLPCEDSLFIGLCGFGRILLILISLALTLTFCLYVIIQWRKLSKVKVADGHYSLNRRMLFVGLLFSAIPSIWLLVSLRTDPSLEPYALESLRANGQEQIQFVAFSDTPIYDQETGRIIGLRLTGTVTVNKAGSYTIHPMRSKGIVPISIRGHENNQYATVIHQQLEGKTPYEFVYLGIIEPLEIMDKGYSPDYIEQIMQAENYSWKIKWRVESYPPFPFYLLGIGAVAQVYPDASGEYAYVTHINSEFQTNEYPKGVFDIR